MTKMLCLGIVELGCGCCAKFCHEELPCPEHPEETDGVEVEEKQEG